MTSSPSITVKTTKNAAHRNVAWGIEHLFLLHSYLNCHRHCSCIVISWQTWHYHNPLSSKQSPWRSGRTELLTSSLANRLMLDCTSCEKIQYVCVSSCCAVLPQIGFDTPSAACQRDQSTCRALSWSSRSLFFCLSSLCSTFKCNSMLSILLLLSIDPKWDEDFNYGEKLHVILCVYVLSCCVYGWVFDLCFVCRL